MKILIKNIGGIDLNADKIDITKSINSLKRSSPSTPFDDISPPSKRVKFNSEETAISQSMYDDLSKTAYGPIQLPLLSPPAISLRHYQENIIGYYEQNKAPGFPKELTKESYTLIVGFFIHYKVFGISLSNLPNIFIQTCLKLFASLIPSNARHVTNSIAYRNNSKITFDQTFSDTTAIQFLSQVLRKEIPFGSIHNILCLFLDYISTQNTFSQLNINLWYKILEDNTNPIVSECLHKLGIVELPESLYIYGHNLLSVIILLMYCNLTTEIPTNLSNEEVILYELFSYTSNIILSDMFNWNTDIIPISETLLQSIKLYSLN